jgi:tRNA-uridine 2-sulfurtransferase
MACIAVALSGGVDSLRAASLLQEMGHAVVGVHIRLLPSSPSGRWSAEEALKTREESVRALAARLNIPLTLIDGREAFEREVILPFLEAYRSGLTPNPCVRCNPTIKFRMIMDEALGLGADAVATGHYARVFPPDEPSRRFRLTRARDLRKDQSYFLFGLQQAQLARTVFPLGDCLKQDVLEWAGNAGFARELPEESQEICFIPSGRYQEFLHERMGLPRDIMRGPIVDSDGRVLGEHHGLYAYTIGQRRGLGIASTAPYYVIDLDAPNNTVHVGRAEDLECGRMTVSHLNWVSSDPPEDTLSCSVRIRNQHRPARALITSLTPDLVQVTFETPQRAVTPGQAAVFYDEEVLLGGGIIQKPQPTT